ncbi:hypothetical protein DP73_20960 [Desulfosporosinus sp. HMP52]|uniref:hypothetical protein n=1 Tax=Desulfosporosinus sp. HMP52 TaxID=1487923 RepID=UPI00051FE8B9|nr:hypothetical protein [Desulfosporosinus sp. HMP52]KGK81964.1 hypothetical protein DP73_20960 [Desulfosporosinus sp. HMP52]
MMSFQPLFIPLYFDKSAEEDLWLAIQQIDPEKRSSFIKEILKQVLVQKEWKEPFNNSHHTLSLDVPEFENVDSLQEEPQIDEQEAEAEPEPEIMFSLEELFFTTEGSTSEDKPAGSINSQVSTSISGYEYMMKHIIGIEEDETVLSFLRGNENPAKNQ